MSPPQEWISPGPLISLIQLFIYAIMAGIIHENVNIV